MSRVARPAAYGAALRATLILLMALIAWLLASTIAYQPAFERPLAPIQNSPADVRPTAAVTSAPFAPAQTAAPGGGVSDPARQTAAPAPTAAPAVPSAKTPVELPNQSFVPGFQPGPKEPVKPSIPPQN